MSSCAPRKGGISEWRLESIKDQLCKRAAWPRTSKRVWGQESPISVASLKEVM